MAVFWKFLIVLWLDANRRETIGSREILSDKDKFCMFCTLRKVQKQMRFEV